MKKFLIIGNMNAITYKEIFPLIKNNQLWAGCKGFSGGMDFNVDDSTYDASKEKQASKIVNGRIVKNIMGCIWFTNLTHSKRTEPIDLYKHYNEEEYPKYDNYDAIEVSRVTEIPMDYDGVMGVPISFLGQYCPTQFEIIDINPHFFSIIEKGLPKPKQLTLNGVGKKDPYARICIKKKNRINKNEEVPYHRQWQCSNLQGDFSPYQREQDVAWCWQGNGWQSR